MGLGLALQIRPPFQLHLNSVDGRQGQFLKLTCTACRLPHVRGRPAQGAECHQDTAQPSRREESPSGRGPSCDQREQSGWGCVSRDATQHTIGRSHINTIHARSALPEKGHRVPCRVRSKGILPSVLGERNRGACRFVLLPILYPQAPLGQRRSLIRRGGRGGLGQGRTGTRFPCLLLLPTQLGFECSTAKNVDLLRLILAPSRRCRTFSSATSIRICAAGGCKWRAFRTPNTASSQALLPT